MKHIMLILGLLLLAIFSKAQNTIPGDQLLADARLLKQALEELHPSFYRYSDTASIQMAYTKLEQNLGKGATQLEAFRYFAEFTSNVRCGHTYPNPYNQKKALSEYWAKENKVLPFTFRIFDGTIVVNQSVDPKLQFGDQIVKMNGVPTSEIIQQLLPKVKADGGRDNKRLIDLELHGQSKYEYFDIYYPLYYDLGETIALDLVADGEERQEQITLLNYTQRAELFKQQHPELTTNYDELWDFKIDDTGTAYLKMGTFVTWRMSLDWKDYLDKAFDRMEREKIQNLIIDIRGNEGGTTDVATYFYKKLAWKDARTVGRKGHLRYKKVSPEVRPHVGTWSRWFYNVGIWTKRVNKHYRTPRFKRNKGKKYKKSKDAYTGKVYLLADASNSSATYFLAEYLSENKLATLVGTETGGTKMGITGGQMFFLNLPNSKIEIDIPLIGYYPVKVMPEEGILPDVLVALTADDFIKGIDPQLEKAKSLIQAQQ